MTRPSKPSEAQARFLASVFSDRQHGGHWEAPLDESAMLPTHLSCIRRGWLEADGCTGKSRLTDRPWRGMVLSAVGMLALAEYFSKAARRDEAFADAVRELLVAAKVAQRVLANNRLASADQNPHGVNDLLGTAIYTMERARR